MTFRKVPSQQANRGAGHPLIRACSSSFQKRRGSECAVPTRHWETRTQGDTLVAHRSHWPDAGAPPPPLPRKKSIWELSFSLFLLSTEIETLDCILKYAVGSWDMITGWPFPTNRLIIMSDSTCRWLGHASPTHGRNGDCPLWLSLE